MDASQGEIPWKWMMTGGTPHDYGNPRDVSDMVNTWEANPVTQVPHGTNDMNDFQEQIQVTWLVVFRHPSEKYERQLGWLDTQYFWESKKWQPNHQPGLYHLLSCSALTNHVFEGFDPAGALNYGIGKWPWGN